MTKAQGRLAPGPIPRAAAPAAEPDLARYCADDVKAFLDQARGLLDFHQKRSDAATTRATALLGFVGVLVALSSAVLNINKTPGVATPDGQKWALYATVGFLLSTACFCLLVIRPRKSSIPDYQDLRAQWRSYEGADSEGRVLAQAVQNLLGADDPADDPVLRGAREANVRLRFLKFALYTLAAALVALAILAVLSVKA